MSDTKNKARPTSIKITLAGTDYELNSPLTLLQLRDIGVGCASEPLADPKAEFARLFDNAVSIISIALKPTYQEMTTEKILSLPMVGTHEMWRVMGEILDFAGLVPVKKAAGKPPGEAPPATP
jgi:hypothetical protein